MAPVSAITALVISKCVDTSMTTTGDTHLVPDPELLIRSVLKVIPFNFNASYYFSLRHR